MGQFEVADYGMVSASARACIRMCGCMTWSVLQASVNHPFLSCSQHSSVGAVRTVMLSGGKGRRWWGK